MSGRLDHEEEGSVDTAGTAAEKFLIDEATGERKAVVPPTRHGFPGFSRGPNRPFFSLETLSIQVRTSVRRWLHSADKYMGELVDGQPMGRGSFFYADGSCFVGQFKHGKRHGQVALLLNFLLQNS